MAKMAHCGRGKAMLPLHNHLQSNDLQFEMNMAFEKLPSLARLAIHSPCIISNRARASAPFKIYSATRTLEPHHFTASSCRMGVLVMVELAGQVNFKLQLFHCKFISPRFGQLPRYCHAAFFVCWCFRYEKNNKEETGSLRRPSCSVFWHESFPFSPPWLPNHILMLFIKLFKRCNTCSRAHLVMFFCSQLKLWLHAIAV